MNVGFGIKRDIVIDDMTDSDNINATRRDISGYFEIIKNKQPGIHHRLYAIFAIHEGIAPQIMFIHLLLYREPNFLINIYVG